MCRYTSICLVSKLFLKQNVRGHVTEERQKSSKAIRESIKYEKNTKYIFSVYLVDQLSRFLSAGIEPHWTVCHVIHSL